MFTPWPQGEIGALGRRGVTLPPYRCTCIAPKPAITTAILRLSGGCSRTLRETSNSIPPHPFDARCILDVAS